MDTRTALLAAGLRAFDRVGFDQATVAAIRAAAGVSNGSFFHFFGSKDRLAAALYLDALRDYHAAMLAPLSAGPDAAAGIAGLLTAHLTWVTGSRPQAKFLFEQTRAEWLTSIRAEQQAENAALGTRIEAWRQPLVAAGQVRPLPALMFTSQLVGPAQVFCRAWLSGRTDDDPRDYTALLTDCALRALLPGERP